MCIGRYAWVGEVHWEVCAWVREVYELGGVCLGWGGLGGMLGLERYVHWEVCAWVGEVCELGGMCLGWGYVHWEVCLSWGGMCIGIAQRLLNVK